MIELYLELKLRWFAKMKKHIRVIASLIGFCSLRFPLTKDDCKVENSCYQLKMEIRLN